MQDVMAQANDHSVDRRLLPKIPAGVTPGIAFIATPALQSEQTVKAPVIEDFPFASDGVAAGKPRHSKYTWHSCYRLMADHLPCWLAIGLAVLRLIGGAAAAVAKAPEQSIGIVFGGSGGSGGLFSGVLGFLVLF